MKRSHKAILYAIERGYFVDQEGQLRNARRQKLRPQYNRDGYIFFKIQPRSKLRNTVVYVHRLQAYLEFGEKIFENGIEVRHLDGNRTNNRRENIAIGTKHENSMDRPSQSRLDHAKLAAKHVRKLSDVQAQALRADRCAGMSYSELTSKYGIAKSTVSYIVNNKTYN